MSRQRIFPVLPIDPTWTYITLLVLAVLILCLPFFTLHVSFEYMGVEVSNY